MDTEKTTTTEDPEVVESATEEAHDTLPELVIKLRNDYETRIAEIQATHSAALADRDMIIQQLITGNPSDPKPHDTFIDRLNAKRNFKKW